LYSRGLEVKYGITNLQRERGSNGVWILQRNYIVGTWYESGGKDLGWPITPKFELEQDFCTMHLAAKFHHPVFNCLEVIMLTNKQTHK